jgi:hypothetical protein
VFFFLTNENKLREIDTGRENLKRKIKEKRRNITILEGERKKDHCLFWILLYRVKIGLMCKKHCFNFFIYNQYILTKLEINYCVDYLKSITCERISFNFFLCKRKLNELSLRREIKKKIKS